MGKTQTKGQQPVKKPKSNKDLKKELEARMFGEKDKKKKKEIQNMIKKLDMDMEKEKKDREKAEAEKKQFIRQLIPVGVDPKTVYCLNFKNKNCNLDDKCQFSHVPPKKEDKKEEDVDSDKPKLVCKFLIDALNNREYSPSWVCPVPKCRDLHKMVEMSENTEVELSLEEFLELQRQTLSAENLTPVTAETFKIWKEKTLKEEELHAKRKAALQQGSLMSLEMLKNRPDLFEDADDAADIDYRTREVSEDSESDNETEE